MVLTIAPTPSSRAGARKSKKNAGDSAKKNLNPFAAPTPLTTDAGRSKPKRKSSLNSKELQAHRRVIWKAALSAHYTNQLVSAKSRCCSSNSDCGSVFSSGGMASAASPESMGRRNSGTTSLVSNCSPSETASGFSFAVKCKLGKTFFSVPRKCSVCQKLLVFTGFACQFCRFRCHKRCANLEGIDENTAQLMRQKACSLSMLPADEELMEHLLRENELDSKYMDVFLEECSAWLSHTPNLSMRPSYASSPRPSSSVTGRQSSISGSALHDYDRSFKRPSDACSSIGPLPTDSSRVTSSSHVTSPRLSTSSNSSSIPVICMPPQSDTSDGLGRCRSKSARHRSGHSSSSGRMRPHIITNVKNGPVEPISARIEVVPPTKDCISSDDSRNTGFYRFWQQLNLWSAGTKPQDGNSDCCVTSCTENDQTDSLKLTIPASSMTGGGLTNSLTKSGANTPIRTPVDDFNDALLADIWNSRRHTTSMHGTMSPAKVPTLTDSGSFDKATYHIAQTDIAHRRLKWAACIAGERVAQSQDLSISRRSEHLRTPERQLLRLKRHQIRSRDEDALHDRTIDSGVHMQMDKSPRNDYLVVSNSHTPVGGGSTLDELDNWVPDWDTVSRLTVDDVDTFTIYGSHMSLNKSKLSATWPPFGLHINYDETEADDEPEPSVSCASPVEAKQSRESHDLSEWIVPISDLQFGEIVLSGKEMTVYRGCWHGEVMLHRMASDESPNFLDEVYKLSRIRHENIALFMGACIDPLDPIVITSVRKGDSLHDTIHLKQKRLAPPTKLSISRQIAQGLAYLHSRGVVLKTLNSRSVFLESKVKISMLDYGCTPPSPTTKSSFGFIPSKFDWLPVPQVAPASSSKSYESQRFALGCLPRGHMTYWAPEVMRTLRVSPPRVRPSVEAFSKESDIYAYGTLLFELCCGDFPFSKFASEAVVWLIGSGHRQQVIPSKLNASNLNTIFRTVIDDCWSSEPADRPQMVSICKELMQTAALTKKRSSSQPEGLNRSAFPFV